MTFPIAADGYAAIFTVLFDEGGFRPSEVRFTGSRRLRLREHPADPEMSGTSPDGMKARYISAAA